MSGDVTLEPTAGDGAPPGWRRAADTPTVRREASADGAVVVKAASGPGRDRLRHEAVVLRVLRGQRLVRLVELREDDRRTTLVMADAGSTSLDALAGDAARTAAALSATCEAVASLHAAGWSHGALETTHVLVGPRDRIRLCSLSRARTLAEHPSGRDGGPGRAAPPGRVLHRGPADPVRSGGGLAVAALRPSVGGAHRPPPGRTRPALARQGHPGMRPPTARGPDRPGPTRPADRRCGGRHGGRPRRRAGGPRPGHGGRTPGRTRRVRPSPPDGQ